MNAADTTVVRIGGRDWSHEEVVRARHLLNSSTMLVKDIARVFGVGARTLTRPDVRRKLGVTSTRPRHGGNNTRGRISLPPNVHPVVLRLFELLNQERATMKETALKAGLCHRAINLWRAQMPRVDNLDAALNVLGYRLSIRPLRDEGVDG